MIAWVRRELRLHDHAVLEAALAIENAMIQPVFVFDSEILERFSNKQDRRLTFLAERLAWMHDELGKRGGGLLVLHGKGRELMPRLAKALGAAAVVAAKDFEGGTRKRDEEVAEARGWLPPAQPLEPRTRQTSRRVRR